MMGSVAVMSLCGPDTGLGARCFVEMHRRVLGGAFGRIPKCLSDDAFSMGGYALDAPEMMPAGGCRNEKFGPGDDDWICEQMLATRGEDP